MSTPEKPRPSLDDTLRKIDEVIVGDESDRCEIEHVTRDYGGLSRTQCPNQAAPGLYYCQPHTERYGTRRKPGSEPRIVAAPAEMTRIVQDEKPRHLTGPPGPTCPGCAADERPGWLARALHRLFG